MDRAKQTASPSSATGEWIQAGGIRLWVEQAGSGEAVLLVAGLGYATWCWRELVHRFSPRWRAVALDNRGAGRSDKPHGPYSIGQIADDAAEALACLGIGSAHVVGHSMGGYIALAMALRHPAQVRSLVLVATSPGGPGALPVPRETLHAWHDASRLGPVEFARRTMPISYSSGWTEAHPEVFEDVLARRLEFPTPPLAWMAQYQACEEYVLRGVEVERIAQPCLVVHGTDDRVVPFHNGELLARRLPDARLARIEGGGHLVFLEDPRRFAELVEGHLARARQNEPQDEQLEKREVTP